MRRIREWREEKNKRMEGDEKNKRMEGGGEENN